jgi:hypothetical protein
MFHVEHGCSREPKFGDFRGDARHEYLTSTIPQFIE